MSRLFGCRGRRPVERKGHCRLGSELFTSEGLIRFWRCNSGSSLRGGLAAAESMRHADTDPCPASIGTALVVDHVRRVQFATEATGTRSQIFAVQAALASLLYGSKIVWKVCSVAITVATLRVTRLYVAEKCEPWATA